MEWALVGAHFGGYGQDVPSFVKDGVDIYALVEGLNSYLSPPRLPEHSWHFPSRLGVNTRRGTGSLLFAYAASPRWSALTARLAFFDGNGIEAERATLFVVGVTG